MDTRHYPRRPGKGPVLASVAVHLVFLAAVWWGERAEVEPLVPEVVSTLFGEHNFHVVENPKTTVVIDDARHFLLTTDKKFDGAELGSRKPDPGQLG